MKYLYPKQLLYLYHRIIETSGGTVGLRDEGLLEAAAYRPQATFAGQDLYPDVFSKAAALGHSLITSHPFVDGNKRVALEAMRVLLRLNGYDLRASQDAKFEFIMEIVKGIRSVQEIADWLKVHSRTYKP